MQQTTSPMYIEYKVFKTNTCKWLSANNAEIR